MKWLIAFIVILLGLSFLFAPEPRPVDLGSIGFETNSSSRMYFHNVRSYYYDIYEREKAPFILYRNKRRSRDTAKADLQFMIVENASAGEAYIFAEANPELERYDSLAVALSETEDEPFEKIYIRDINNEGHYRLAAKVYARLLVNEQIHLMSRNDTIRELYVDKREELAAETTLEDYFKLVNKI